MNKIMHFVQPIRLGHVTSHMSTNLHHHQHSSPPPPLASLGIPHLCPLTTTFMTCQNTAMTAETCPLRRHTSSQHTNDTNRPQLVENAPDATGDRAEGTREGRGAHKGQRAGVYKVCLPFLFFLLHLLISVSPKQVPLCQTSKTHLFGHVLVFGSLSHLLDT